jgi:hypothetical protein
MIEENADLRASASAMHDLLINNVHSFTVPADLRSAHAS